MNPTVGHLLLNQVGEVTVASLALNLIQSFVSSSDSICHLRLLPDFDSKWKNKKQKKKARPFISPSSSIPHWRFPATFQAHYRDLRWDYDKNTCFLPFWSDQGHFSLSFFFAISYQSSTHLNDLPLFKQLTSLASKEPTGASHENSRSILSKSTTSTFVLFITLSKPSSANEASCTTLSVRPLSWYLSMFPFPGFQE